MVYLVASARQTATAGTDFIAAPGTGLRILIYGIHISPGSGGNVQLTDGTGGTQQASADGPFNMFFPNPLLLTANTALRAIATSATASISVYYQVRSA